MPGLSLRCFLVACAGGALMLAAALPAAAEDPSLLGAYKSWFTYSLGSGEQKVCYALSKPTSEEPRKVKRDPAFLLINDWPGRKAKGEPEVVPGYQYRDGSPVTAEVGTTRFTFFTKNDGGAGAAWVLAQADEERLVNALKSAATVTVSGVSKRGTTTHDTYSLDGFADALDKIHQACGM